MRCGRCCRRRTKARCSAAFGWPSVLALLGIGWWIVAAAWDLEVATIVLIFGSLTVLLIPLLRKADAIRALSNKDRDRWMTVWPLAALAGWLTVAAPVNLLTVATGNGDLPAALPPTAWALIAVVAAAAHGAVGDVADAGAGLSPADRLGPAGCVRGRAGQGQCGAGVRRSGCVAGGAGRRAGNHFRAAARAIERVRRPRRPGLRPRRPASIGSTWFSA